MIPITRMGAFVVLLGRWGVYNATAPAPVRMKSMCKALGSAVARPSWLPVPEFALQAILGEGASV
eukprot:8779627-Pyramimonas_sp.AAC.1